MQKIPPLRKLSTFLGLVFGILLAYFGVFFFNFQDFLSYDGRSLVGPNSIFLEIMQNTFVGLYEFTWMSFRFNLFNFIFSSITSTLIIEGFLPVFLAWLFTGLITGLFVIGTKRGLLFSFIVISLLVILWLCFAVISQANITFVFVNNIFETGGGILTALISVLIGGSIGGSISGAISRKMQGKNANKNGK